MSKDQTNPPAADLDVADDPAAAAQAAHEAAVRALMDRGYRSGSEKRRAKSRKHAEFLLRSGVEAA